MSNHRQDWSGRIPTSADPATIATKVPQPNNGIISTTNDAFSIVQPLDGTDGMPAFAIAGPEGAQSNPARGIADAYVTIVGAHSKEPSVPPVSCAPGGAPAGAYGSIRADALICVLAEKVGLPL